MAARTEKILKDAGAAQDREEVRPAAAADLGKETVAC
jgi:hypothetical protein